MAELTKRHISRVFRWTYPKSRGGSDGFIPWAEAVKLLAFAPKHGVELTPADFFPSPTETPPAVGPCAPGSTSLASGPGAPLSCPEIAQPAVEPGNEAAGGR